MSDKKCEAGCVIFHGGEVKHESDCVFYPESLTEMRDKQDTKITALRAEVEGLREASKEAFNLIGGAQFYVDNIGNFEVKPGLSQKLKAAMELLTPSPNDREDG